MYIGRIITKSKNLETLDFVDITQNTELLNDKTIPTLIIGKENAEKIYGKDRIRVLDKKIENNVFWTFGKLERRNDYERGLSEFNNFLLKKFLESVKYEYFNLFTKKYSDVKELLSRVKHQKNNVFYITERQMYMLSGNIVIGIDFNELEYFGVQKEKIIEVIKSNKDNKIISNDYFMSKNMRKYVGNNRIIVPYVYFLTKN